MLLKTDEAFTGYSVRDIDEAKRFYGETLGLELRDPGMGNVELGLGAARVLLYPKPNHEPATFTVLNFPVDDIDAAVDELVAKGVELERYASEHIPQDARGILRGKDHDRGPNVAWFRDPSGNILSVLEP